jgi:KAP family P-loop domain
VAAPLGFWERAKERGLVPTEETRRLVALAYQAERQRDTRQDDEDADRLSRTAILWAGATIDEGTRHALDEAGLDLAMWSERNGFASVSPQVPDSVPDDVPVNEQVIEALDQALKLTTGGGLLTPPALIAGVLSTRRGLFPKLLRDHSKDADRALEVLRSRVVTGYAEASTEPVANKKKATKPGVDTKTPQAKRAPDKVAGSASTTATEPAVLTPTDALPIASNDLARASDDLLNTKQYAHLFARLVAARALHPPLAFGLFGAWGAGKSYFMDLMEDHVDKLAKRDDPKAVSWQKICQVRFNAWHYMDADLWASMAGELFEQIAEFLGGKTSDVDEIAARRQALKRQLHSTIEAENEAKRRKLAAERSLAERHAALLKAEEAYERKRSALDDAVDAKVLSELQTRLNEDSLAAALKALGLDDNLPRLEQLEEVTLRARKVGGDAQTLTWRLHEMLIDLRTKPVAWIAGAVVLFAIPLVTVYLGTLNDKHALLGLFRGRLSTVAAEVTAAVALFANRFGVVVDRANGLVTQANEVLDFAQGVKAEGDELRHKALDALSSDAAGDKENAKTGYDDAAQDVELARAGLADVRGDIQRIQDSIDAIRAGKLVYDFVLERSADNGVYRSREGIVSIVRRDLETLSGLLVQWNNESEQGETAKKAATEEDGLRPLPEAAPLAPDELETLPLQRIVLYIDDLDRCPPERVTEVLQAVHLLLAFDLFVVVVAVDPRWLERSLERSYQKLIVAGSNGNDGFHHKAATARDYLEKIFQVPFTIPRVDENGFDKLLDHHLKTRAQVKAAAPQAGTERSRDAGDSGAGDAGAGDAGETAAGDSGSAATAGDTTTAIDTAESVDFFIEEAEQTFARDLWHLFRTPRSIKRFANIYRLLRSTLSERPLEEYNAFVKDDRHAGHRAVLTLLAANTVYPRVTTALLRAIVWPNLVPEKARPSEWTTLMQALRDPKSDFRKALDLDVEQEAELTRLLPVLNDVESQVPTSLEPYVKWASAIGRFSLYWYVD